MDTRPASQARHLRVRSDSGPASILRAIVLSSANELRAHERLQAIEQLASTPDEVVIAAIGPTVQRYLTDPDLL